MEKELVPFLEKLSEKLGTTAEHLWQILIKQAPIDGMIDILSFISSIAVSIILYFVHKYLEKIKLYDEYEYVGILMICGAIIMMLWFVISFIVALGSITAFLNPEYWAFNQILSRLGK